MEKLRGEAQNSQHQVSQEGMDQEAKHLAHQFVHILFKLGQKEGRDGTKSRQQTRPDASFPNHTKLQHDGPCEVEISMHGMGD